jgi:peptide/nickel transport system permease protein
MKKFSFRKISIIIIVLMVLIGVFYPLISPYSPDDFSFDSLLKPSLTHLLGTDEMGHDIFSMLLVGFRVTIGISIISAVASTVIGTVLGVMCAYFKGFIDTLIIKTTELFIIIPEIVILMFFAAFSEPNIFNTIAAISFFSWSKVCRIIRANAIVAIDKDDIKYTLLLKGKLRDIIRKLWREIYPIVSTMFVMQCSKAAIYESTLSFFGIGDPLTKSWGKIIKLAMNYEGIFTDNTYVYYLMPPILCICIFVVVLSHIAYESGGDDL